MIINSIDQGRRKLPLLSLVLGPPAYPAMHFLSASFERHLCHSDIQYSKHRKSLKNFSITTHCVPAAMETLKINYGNKKRGSPSFRIHLLLTHIQKQRYLKMHVIGNRHMNFQLLNLSFAEQVAICHITEQ